MKKYLSLFMVVAMILCNLGITVNASVEEDYSIAYYEGGFGSLGDDGGVSLMNQPVAVKINSPELLASSWLGDDEVLAKYDEAFFNDSFVLFVCWAEPVMARSRQISAVTDNGEMIDIEVSKYWLDGAYPTVVTSYSAALEMPLSLYEREVSVTQKDYDEEPITPTPQVITVKAPTVSVASGAVPSGQLVIIENNSGIGTLMYSYGDGRWIAADSPLKLIIGDELSLSVKVNVDSPEPNKEYVCEEATYTYTVDFSTEAAPNEYEEKYNVSYYNGGIGNEYAGEKVPPYGNKISSVEELSSLYIRRPEYLAEMKEKYDEEFFEENFLVVVSWEQSHGARDRYLEKVEINEDDVNIVMGEALYCGMSTQAFESFCAIVEMPISEDEKALMVDGKYFFVPPLCIEPTVPPSFAYIDSSSTGNSSGLVTGDEWNIKIYANYSGMDMAAICSYDKDGRLLEVYSSTAINTDFEKTITVSENTYEIKALAWNGMTCVVEQPYAICRSVESQ